MLNFIEILLTFIEFDNGNINHRGWFRRGGMRALAEAGCKVTVIDRRDHIRGNAFDLKDEHGILIHQYGPHIFHTNNERIFSYLSKFTEWRPYEHRVLGG